MKEYSSYGIKICHYNRIFEKTVEMYRSAVDFFITVCLEEWEFLQKLSGKERNNEVEKLTIRTKKRPEVRYDFSEDYYKFPSYLRRSAISEAIGKVSSYHSNLENWKISGKGRKPGPPSAGNVFPVLYKKSSYLRTGEYTAKIKVYLRNTWDWLEVSLRKTDVDYIRHHCGERKECVPVLKRKGREWFLNFSFEETVSLSKVPVREQRILAVDLGMNQACVCTAMKPDGTVLGREFLSLSREKDLLKTAVNRIRKAQKHGAVRTPRLWALARGRNDRIAVLTADFIMEKARKYQVDVIVFEYLELNGKKRGRHKQRLHLWKAKYVQNMVSGKAHREGIRLSRVNARGTSAYAFDGSGRVERNIDRNYSICRFSTGKLYHCDLNASYNIGARYYIREHLKSLPEKERLGIEAKVPQCTRRSTCTLSTLTDLYAVLPA
ncbi:MAG: transposase [Lachnospiraceae bacterium]|nr:transposase [Lachnospiraceae bacterium]